MGKNYLKHHNTLVPIISGAKGGKGGGGGGASGCDHSSDIITYLLIPYKSL